MISYKYRLTKDVTGYFTTSGNKLLTAWSMPIMPGLCPVRVRAVEVNSRSIGTAEFSVAVSMSGPSPPPPPVPSITVNGSANAVVAEGAALTVSAASGAGNRTDWVGLAAADRRHGRHRLDLPERLADTAQCRHDRRDPSR
jgi:hypothetical protein